MSRSAGPAPTAHPSPHCRHVGVAWEPSTLTTPSDSLHHLQLHRLVRFCPTVLEPYHHLLLLPFSTKIHPCRTCCFDECLVCALCHVYCALETIALRMCLCACVLWA